MAIACFCCDDVIVVVRVFFLYGLGTCLDVSPHCYLQGYFYSIQFMLCKSTWFGIVVVVVLFGQLNSASNLRPYVASWERTSWCKPPTVCVCVCNSTKRDVTILWNNSLKYIKVIECVLYLPQTLIRVKRKILKEILYMRYKLSLGRKEEVVGRQTLGYARSLWDSYNWNCEL